MRILYLFTQNNLSLGDISGIFLKHNVSQRYLKEKFNRGKFPFPGNSEVTM